ncbi:hypothetical protein AMECASPLE_036612 [Ameca splendens]|uniref:Uncharacterized protein n=1 Tax=Ameca splendens TaxID=208324 RepID=A0ABV1A405_9TELE
MVFVSSSSSRKVKPAVGPVSQAYVLILNIIIYTLRIIQLNDHLFFLVHAEHQDFSAPAFQLVVFLFDFIFHTDDSPSTVLSATNLISIFTTGGNMHSLVLAV